MAKVYSTRFLAAHAGATPSYSVPAQTLVVVRCITAFNADLFAPVTAQLVLSTLSITLWEDLLAPQGVATVNLRAVCYAGETLSIAGGGGLDMTVSGYLLTLP